MTVVRKNKHLIAFLTYIYAPLYCSFARKETAFVYQTKAVFFNEINPLRDL